MEATTVSPRLPPPPAPKPARRGPDRTAIRECWHVLWSSRLLAWAAGMYGIISIGFPAKAVLPASLSPYGALGNVLIGPQARWDSGWYLAIAQHPYAGPAQAAFFPLYPFTMKLVGAVLGDLLISGVLVSLVAFGFALYFLHRLATIEIGPERARIAVAALAFFPTAFFFSAIYAESLLLALMIGSVYYARMGRWWAAGVLAAFASATHNSGVVLIVPLALLYLYGPRADREPVRGSTRRWLPRYTLRPDVLWLALVPVGLFAFLAYMGVAHGQAFLPLNANDTYWHRHFSLLDGFPQGLVAAWDAIAWIANGADPHSMLYTVKHGSFELAGWELTDAVFLIFAVCAVIGVLRRLPFAYGAYCACALLVGTSAPRANEPLVSFPRYALVLFPCALWLAMWSHDRRRQALSIGVLGVGMGVLAMQFATWRWVA